MEGLTSGGGVLRDSASEYFKKFFGSPRMHFDKGLDNGLAWTPSLRFKIREHINVFVEPSEMGPFPRILELNIDNILDFPRPISVYIVCPEDVISRPDQRSERKRLQGSGCGLISVDSKGIAHQEFSAIPLIQVIRRTEFDSNTKKLPPRIKQRLSEAFDDYCSNPINGVKSLSELVEGLIMKAAKDAQRRKGTKNISRLNSAEILDELYSVCQAGRSAIGGARSYMGKYRNLSHHWPRNQRDSYNKYSSCRDAFLEGVRSVRDFRQAMMNWGLTGSLR